MPRLTGDTLHGVWPALIVPWNDRDELDEPRFAAEIGAYAGTGVHGIYTGGTTGEFYGQDDATFERVATIACREGHALELPVQIGCTALSTRTVSRRIRTAIAVGADGIQLAIPFWLELADGEVLDFFRSAADAAGDAPAREDREHQRQRDHADRRQRHRRDRATHRRRDHRIRHADDERPLVRGRSAEVSGHLLAVQRTRLEQSLRARRDALRKRRDQRVHGVYASRFRVQ